MSMLWCAMVGECVVLLGIVSIVVIAIPPWWPPWAILKLNIFVLSKKTFDQISGELQKSFEADHNLLATNDAKNYHRILSAGKDVVTSPLSSMATVALPDWLKRESYFRSKLAFSKATTKLFHAKPAHICVRRGGYWLKKRLLGSERADEWREMKNIGLMTSWQNCKLFSSNHSLLQ